MGASVPPPSGNPLVPPEKAAPKGIAPDSPTVTKALANQKNFFYAVFIALLSSVNTVAGLAQTQSRKVMYNANLQMKMNQGMNKLQQIVVPQNATSAELKHIDNVNANLTIVRQNQQGEVLSLRQEGQQLSTQAQVYVNYMQQNGSEVTAVLKIIIVVTQLINKISPGAK